MRNLVSVFSFVLFISFAGTASAAEYGSRDEAIAMVKKVQEMFKSKGPKATFEAVTAQSKGFKDRDLYPFIYDLKGINMAHGAKAKLVGRDLSGLKDLRGKLVIKEMLELVQAGKSGWVDYSWPNPQTKKLEEKSSYVEKLGGTYFVGVGIYKK